MVPQNKYTSTSFYSLLVFFILYSASIYFFKIYNRNTKKIQNMLKTNHQKLPLQHQSDVIAAII